MVVPGTAADRKWRAASPVAQVEIDVVRKLRDFKLAYTPIWGGNKDHSYLRGYVAEAQLALKELGLRPHTGLRLKMDCGILESDRDGTTTVRRVYWANKLRLTVSDIPSEARVQPDLWGWIRFMDRGGKPSLGKPADLGGQKAEEEEDVVDDLELE